MRRILLSSLCIAVLGTFSATALPVGLPERTTKAVSRDSEREEMYYWQGFYVLIHEDGARFTYRCSGYVYATSKSEAMQFAQADLQRQSSTTANIWRGSIGDSGITRLSK